jgi:hypothetical protein
LKHGKLLGTKTALAVQEVMPKFASLTVSGFLFFGALGCQAHAGPNDDILAASKAGDKAAVEEALTQGASVDTVDSLGIPAMTPLGLAAVLRSRERRWAFDRFAAPA